MKIAKKYKIAPSAMSDFRRVFEPKKQIFNAGDARQNIYIIEQGQVEISSQRGGEPVPLMYLNEGDIFGEMALLDGAPRSTTATALKETSVFAISRDMVNSRLQGLDPLVRLLMSVLIERHRKGEGLSPEASDSQPHENMMSLEWNVQKEMALKELGMVQNIRSAIDLKEFVPYLHPIVSLPDYQLLGFETLIRWQHPESGVIAPYDFIPVAERSGLIQELDLLMFREACYFVDEVQEAVGCCNRKIYVTVNLSGENFHDMVIVDKLKAILKETQVDAHCIELEVTETAFMNEPMVAQQVLKDLKNLGLSIALDDFGTGYSSLGYLHSFPIDTVKIDRSFVQNLSCDRRSLDIVRAIVMMAQSFGIQVVAEGIESEEEAAALVGVGCSVGQGFLFSQPLQIDAALKYARETVEKLY